MSEATLILRRKRTYDDQAVAELKAWQVSAPVRKSRHIFNYLIEAFNGRLRTE